LFVLQHVLYRVGKNELKEFDRLLLDIASIFLQASFLKRKSGI
jgi:hypothetical protein